MYHSEEALRILSLEIFPYIHVDIWLFMGQEAIRDDFLGSWEESVCFQAKEV